MLEIESQDIKYLKDQVPSFKIPEVKGIMQIHQVVFSRGVMNTRSLSCFDCPISQHCDHFANKEIFQDTFEVSETEDHLDEPNTNIQIIPAKPTRRLPAKKLNVDEVYSSSDEETEIFGLSKKLKRMLSKKPENVKCGDFLKVEYTRGSKTDIFTGITQKNMEKDEVEVMFLKPCQTEKSLLSVNEKDVFFVSKHQILAVLPPAKMFLNGNRVFYKFKNNSS